MKSSVNKFSKGLISDLNPINQPNQSYQDSMGGNLIYNADGNYDWVISNGNKVSFSILPNGGAISTKYTPIGGVGNSNIKVLFSVDENNGDSEIGIFSINSDGVGAYKTLFNDNGLPVGERLLFLADNQIEARFLYENDELIRVYWVDGVKADSNRPRVFTFEYDDTKERDDVTAYSPISASTHSINMQADHNPGIIKFQETINGSILVGIYQYTYRLITIDGYATPWTTPTRRLFVTSDGVNTSDWNKYEMEVSGISTPKGNRLEIKGIDTKYEFIEVAYIYSQTDLQVDETTIFHKSSISSASMVIDHASMTGEPLIAAEIATQFQGIKAAKTLDVKDSVLYFGNIIENLSLITDAEAEAIVASLAITPIFKDMRSDEQNYSNITSPILTHQTPKNGHTEVQLHSGGGGVELYNIANDYVNYKGTQIDHLYPGYWRGETYRYALQLYDVLGLPVFAIHLGDFKFPEQYTTAYNWTRLTAAGGTVVGSGNIADPAWVTNNYNDAGLKSDKVWSQDPDPAHDPLTGISYLRIMGINFDNIDLSGVIGRVSGFSIVRTDLDATILAQGMVMPCNSDEDSNSKGITRPFEGINQRWFDVGVGGPNLNTNTNPVDVKNEDVESVQLNAKFGMRANISSFYAPDYDFDSSFIPVVQSQDTIKLVGGCFSKPNPSTDYTPANVLAQGFFTYRKDDTTVSDPTKGGLHSIIKYYNTKNDFHLTSSTPYPRYGAAASIIESIATKIDSVTTEYIPGLDLHNTVHFQEGGLQGYHRDNNDELRGSSKDLIYYTHGNYNPRTGAAGTAENWSPLFLQTYFGADYHLGSFIGNYVRQNLSPYGGVTESSLEQSVFYSTGHFQPLNNATFTTPGTNIFSGIEVFGGDCYLDYFGFLRSYPRYQGTSNDEWDVADGCVFPLESKLNHTLRQAPSIGDPQYTEVGALPKDQFLGNLVTNFANGLFFDRPTGTSFLEEFNLNAALLQREQLKFFFSKTVGFSDNNKYPVRWRYTQNKFYGEELDSWRKFLANEYDDINGTYGEIVSSSYLFNQIYSFQESAFGRLRAFDRALLDSSSGSLTTGTGGKLDGIDYISTKYGNQHQFSMVNSGKAVYWIDVDKRKAVRFAGDGKQSISDVRGLHEFFKNELGHYYNEDSPAGGFGLAVGYDFRNNNVFWTFVRDYHRLQSTTFAPISSFPESVNYYENNSTVFLDWQGIDAAGTGIQFASNSSAMTNVVNYVALEAGSLPMHIHNDGTSIARAQAGEYWEVKRDSITGDWVATQVTLADITPFKATICYNEDLDAFTGFFGFRPTYYISHKDMIITHDKLFPSISNQMYVHGFNQNKANYYGQDYKSYISVSSKEDEFSTKIFDTVRVNFNEQGNDDISRFIFRTEGQTYQYDVQTDTRKKYLEDSLRMPTRTFNQSDRARGKWINYIFEFKNNTVTPVKLFNLITNYRTSKRM